MVIIGSLAAAHYNGYNVLGNDIDIIAKREEIEKWYENNRNTIDIFYKCSNINDRYLCKGKLDKGSWKLDYQLEFFEAVNDNSDSDLLKSCTQIFNIHSDTYSFMNKIELRVPSLLQLMMIKRAHLYWPHNWMKHMKDYTKFKWWFISMPEYRPNINLDTPKKRDFRKSEDHLFELFIRTDPFYNKRLKESELRFGKKEVCLNMPNDKFFKKSENKVHRTYDHDDLHRIIAGDRSEPMFERIKENKSSANVSKKLFDLLSYNDKCLCVLEEIYAIALERILIPAHQEGYNIRSMCAYAFIHAYTRVCTILTKGWFRDFSIENFHNIISHIHNIAYINRFLSAVESGKLKPNG